MNLRTIKSNVARWLRPTEKDKAEITRQISDRLRYNRQLLKRSGTVWDDQEQAQQIAQSRRRRLRFWLNQRLISAEKRRVEPAAKWVYGADLFKIIERLSPTLEALGVIAIPLVLFFATQRYQDGLEQRELEKLQQETVANYLNQLSTILLDVDGDLRDPQNEKLRTLTTATTLTLLRDPSLDGARRSQVMRFLHQIDLINSKPIYGPQRSEDRVSTLDFSRTNLVGIDWTDTFLQNVSLSASFLDKANLSGADLGGASIRGSSLFGSDLRNASLADVDLSYSGASDVSFRDAYLGNAILTSVLLYDADLRNANFDNASLRGAYLKGADLRDASLRDAHLDDADLYRAKLHHADLHGVDLRFVKNLTQAQVSSAYLCETVIPQSIDLSSNRDCETLKQLKPLEYALDQRRKRSENSP